MREVKDKTNARHLFIGCLASKLIKFEQNQKEVRMMRKFNILILILFLVSGCAVCKSPKSLRMEKSFQILKDRPYASAVQFFESRGWRVIKPRVGKLRLLDFKAKGLQIYAAVKPGRRYARRRAFIDKFGVQCMTFYYQRYFVVWIGVDDQGIVRKLAVDERERLFRMRDAMSGLDLVF